MLAMLISTRVSAELWNLCPIELSVALSLTTSPGLLTASTALSAFRSRVPSNFERGVGACSAATLILIEAKTGSSSLNRGRPGTQLHAGQA